MEGRKRKLTSSVWDYFSPAVDRKTAICSICKKSYSTPNKSTTGLGRHLRQKHKIFLDSFDENAKFKPEEFISKLTASDGIPFSVVAKSESIQGIYHAATGNHLPTSPNGIRDAMMRYYDEVKKKTVIKQIEETKSKGFKFSVSLDEWTSGARRRYMNVNLHYESGFWNLGLLRIKGSFTSEACLKLLMDRLAEFGLHDKDIFGLVTDGAAVMKKLGDISLMEQQLCQAHGLHLAVSDVLYKKANHEIESESQDEVLIESDEVIIESDEEHEDLDENEESNEPEDLQLEYQPQIHDVVAKVRKLVKLFRYSPLKNDVLSKHALKEACLILDVKTRWGSLLMMITRFLELKDAIKKALIDLREPLCLSDDDFNILEDLKNILEPVQLATEQICQRDATLGDADVALNFMLNEVGRSQSNLGKSLYQSLLKRVNERRTILSELFGLLHFKDGIVPGHAEGHFQKMTKSLLVSEIKRMYDFYDNEEEVEPPPEVIENLTEVESQSLLQEMSLSSKLKLAIQRARNPEPVSTVKHTLRNGVNAIKGEITAFQNTGSRGKITSFVYSLLLTVPPSSVEAERAFSAANNFCGRTRARLGDETMNALSFLKSYFKKDSC